MFIIEYFLAAWAGLAACFGVVAVTFQWFCIAQPTWLIRALVGVAVLATVVVLLFVWADEMSA